MQRPESSTAIALIEAATELFAHKGFTAASTREIAAKAGTNVASIAYHFGSKEGLRLACGLEFAHRLGTALGSVPDPESPTPEEARATLTGILRAMLPVILDSTRSEQMVRFVLREIFEAGATADLVYTEFVEPAHRRLCRLWACASGGEADDPNIKLRVFSFLGQLLYFRVATPFVLRRMDWPALTETERAAIITVLLDNLAALLAAPQGQ